MCSVGGQPCKTQTADYCFHHTNKYVTIRVPLYPKNNSPLSVCSLHFTLPPVLGKKAMNTGAPNGNFRENISSEDDLRSRIFGAFVAKFLACLPLLGFSNIYKMV